MKLSQVDQHELSAAVETSGTAKPIAELASFRRGETPLFQINADDGSVADTEIQSESDEECD
jgi:hypothetical protein